MEWFRGRKNKKSLSIIFFFVLFIQVIPYHDVLAQELEYETPMDYGTGDSPVSSFLGSQTQQSTQATSQQPITQNEDNGDPFKGCGLNAMGECFKGFFVWLLLQIRNFVYTYIAAPAAVAFVWVMNPANISGKTGILNAAGIYALWQFIRDFFNLFFIMVLLFSAFSTIFQVESFNIRNIYKSVLFAALFINFSFPITRFLIDLANVPMYYFINDMIASGSGNGGEIVMNNLLGASGISAGAMTNVGDSGSITAILMSIIFAFLFGISLLVLSVMLIIRLIALTLLLIFSPIGFASSMLPAFGRYGSEWWGNFWKYALFGPLATLMLVVSVKFLQAIQAAGWKSIGDAAINQSAGSDQAVSIASVIYFSIPIILIWFTISLGQRSSLAGAGAIVGMGMWLPNKIRDYGKKAVVKTASFTGSTVKKTAAGTTKFVASPVLDRARGAYAGAKQSVTKDGKLFGKERPLLKWIADSKKRTEEREARAKGFVSGGRAGAKKEIEKIQTKRQYEVAEDMKKNNVGTLDLRAALASGDAVKSAAAAMVLADRKAIDTTAELNQALAALGNNTKEIAEVIDRAGEGAIKGMDETQYRTFVGSSPVTSDPSLRGKLNDRLVKDGNSKILVDYELGGATAPATMPAIEAAVQKVLRSMKTAKDVVNQESLFNDPTYGYAAISEIRDQIISDPNREVSIRKASADVGSSVGAMI